MSKDSSARYSQKNKEKIKKKSRERHQNLSEEEKTKSEHTVVNDLRISQKMKNKG